MIKKYVLIAVVIICVVAAALLIIYHKAVYLVLCNLTSPEYDLPEADDWSGGEVIKGISYADISESEYLDLYIPKGETDPPLFVLVHGGGFLFGDTETRQCRFMYRYFRDHGFAVASVQYRMAKEAAYPAAVEDVKAAVRFLRAHAADYGYDASRIAIWGESAGGYLATMAALTNDGEFNDVPFVDQDKYGDVSAGVDVLIDYYGVCDFTNNVSDLREDGVPKLVYNIANSWAAPATGEYDFIEEAFLHRHLSDMSSDEIQKLSPAYYAAENLRGTPISGIWIAHGGADITVSKRQSLRLLEACENAGAAVDIKYRELPKCKHADDRFYTDEELSEVEEYIKRCL